jgi:hypothetical protein
MNLEIVYFLFESNELILENPKKSVWTENFSAHFCIFTIAIQNLKFLSLFIYQLVGPKLLYKIHYFNFFVFQQDTSISVFPKHLFLTNRLFDQKTFCVECRSWKKPVGSALKTIFHVSQTVRHYFWTKTDTKFLTHIQNEHKILVPIHCFWLVRNIF